MNKKTILIGVLGLALLWVVVFFAANQLINRDKDDVPNNALIENIPTQEASPSATASPEALPTDEPEVSPTPTETFTPSPTETPTRQPLPEFSLPGLDLEGMQSAQARNATPFPTIEIPIDEEGGAYPIRLAIEDLGILSSVVAVQTDPSFNIVTPRQEVGYYALTSKIGGGGNTVMVGHVYPGRIFNKLLDARVGQIIRITDEHYNEHYYRVTEVRRLPYESGTERDRELGFEYMYDESEERLTLVTCYPEFEWTHRFVVRARPIDPPDDANSDDDAS